MIPDPKAKKPAGKGAAEVVPEKPAGPRMITPPPFVMQNESGRRFRVELGKNQTIESSIDETKNLEPTASIEEASKSASSIFPKEQ